MQTSRALLVGLGALSAITAAPAQAETREWRLHDDHVLGTSLDLVVTARSQAAAMIAAAAARAEIDRLDAILSGWRGDSELAALNASSERVVSRDLFEVLRTAEAWRVATDGAFDARQGAVTAARRAGLHQAALTDGAVGLDAATRTVTKPTALSFDLDGIAKGHIVDRALAAARAASPDVTGLMIDIGGDLRCWGQAARGEAWRIGVADACETADNAAPAMTLAFHDGAIAYSGRGARDVIIDGVAESHFLDPKTGAAATAPAACVFAATAADADALATAFSVMDADAAMALADRTPGVEALIWTATGGRRTSAGWSSLVDTREGPRAAQLIRVADGAVWPRGFQVGITYEIPKIVAGNYRAPYVAVWITDESKQLVRVITMLGDDAKYVPDNYVFWRRYGRKTPEVASTARPTRAPGRYSLVWDGRDQAGKPVAQGKYTVHVEAVREHGGHSYVSQDLDLAAAPITAAVPGKEELGGVSLRYGKTK